jgi:large subunit ribosomal protein L25
MTGQKLKNVYNGVMIKLTVEKRNDKDTAAFLRANGKIPAVFYGKKEASTPISIALSDFKKCFREAGETSIINLVGEGIDVEVLVQDVEQDAVSDVFTHVDFYAIEKGKKLEISVPLDFFGIAPAVRDLGAVLIKVMHEIDIEALPKDLPKEIKVDISGLTTLDSQILAKDLILPEGVTLTVKPEEVVAAVSEVKEEVEVAAPVDIANIEVEKKGKEAKEGAEGEAAPEAKK